MGMNAVYRGPEDCPAVIPVFPLPGALLLPRGQMPLNIFEPRYLAMVDDALKGDRIIGMIQPDAEAGGARLVAEALSGRLRGPDHAVRRDRATAATSSRSSASPASGSRRSCRPRRPTGSAASTFEPFAADFIARAGEEEVDRAGVLKALRDFVEAADVRVDWEGIDQAPNEALVNALCMMSPFGAAREAGPARGARPEDAAPRC